MLTKEQLHSLHPKSADHVWYNTPSVPAFSLVERKQTGVYTVFAYRCTDWGVDTFCVQMYRLGFTQCVRTDAQTGGVNTDGVHRLGRTTVQA